MARDALAKSLRRREALGALAAWACFPAVAQSAQAGLVPARVQALEAEVRSSHPQLRALLIERGGTTAFSHYRADTAPQTRLNVASITKSVLALLVGIAIERGAIRGVDEPVAAFFPEHPAGGDASRVTLRHLLTMSSGFDARGLNAQTDYPDFTQRLYAPGLLQHALSRRVAGPPGERFYYSNLDSHLVAMMLARRVKQPLGDFAREALFAPLGIADVEWPAGSDGVPNGASELRLAAPELARIGRLVVQAGQWEGRQLVPRAFIEEATRRHLDSDLPAREPRALWGYGYLWWTAATPGDNLRAFYAAGFGGQFLYLVPALDLVLVALTEQVSREVAGRTAALIRNHALPAVAR